MFAAQTIHVKVTNLPAGTPQWEVWLVSGLVAIVAAYLGGTMARRNSTRLHKHQMQVDAATAFIRAHWDVIHAFSQAIAPGSEDGAVWLERVSRVTERVSSLRSCQVVMNMVGPQALAEKAFAAHGLAAESMSQLPVYREEVMELDLDKPPKLPKTTAAIMSMSKSREAFEDVAKNTLRLP